MLRACTFFPPLLLEPDTNATPVLGNELNSGILQSGLDCINGSLLERLSSLEAYECIGRHQSQFSQLADSKLEGGSGHSALRRCQNRHSVSKTI